MGLLLFALLVVYWIFWLSDALAVTINGAGILIAWRRDSSLLRGLYGAQVARSVAKQAWNKQRDLRVEGEEQQQCHLPQQERHQLSGDILQTLAGD